MKTHPPSFHWLLYLVSVLVGLINLHAFEVYTHKNMGDFARQGYIEYANKHPDEIPSGQMLSNEKYWPNIRNFLIDEDNGLNPLQHFWNPEGGENDGLLFNDSALHRAIYWQNWALLQYWIKDYADAFDALGRVCHLIGDMGCPAHTLLDPHPDIDLGGGAFATPDIDSLHTFANKAEHQVHWTSQQMDPGGSISLTTLMGDLARFSRQWDSDDANGTGEFGRGSGSLNQEIWNLDASRPWYIELWQANGLSQLVATLRGPQNSYIRFFRNRLSSEVITMLSSDNFDPKQLHGQLLSDLQAIVNGDLLTNAADFPNIELSDVTKSWVGWYIIEPVNSANRLNLAILASAFPEELHLDRLDSMMINPIYPDDLQSIIRACMPQAELAIARAYLLFLSTVRPKILDLLPSKDSAGFSNDNELEITVRAVDYSEDGDGIETIECLYSIQNASEAPIWQPLLASISASKPGEKSYLLDVSNLPASTVESRVPRTPSVQKRAPASPGR